MVDLSRHAPRYTTEGNVSNTIDNIDACPLSIPIEANANAAEDDSKAHEAIGTADETDVVLIEAKTILVSNQHTVGAGSKTWAYARLQTHTRDRASAITTLSRLQAAATTKVTLAALVVAPTRSGLNVIQSLLPQVSLCTREANHTRDPTRTSFEWRLTHRNGEFV